MSSDDIYRIKTISYDGRRCSILMQNENGPCPLLAISNILLLQQKIHIHPDLAYINFRQLIQMVGNYLVEYNPPHPNPEMQANQQQQIADSLAVLPKLGRGLDVNIRFQKITDFEYTDELSVMDMLGINLVHGWLCDPQDEKAASVIKDLSYNQLICELVELDHVANTSQKPASQKPSDEALACAAAWAKLPSVVSWNTKGVNPSPPAPTTQAAATPPADDGGELLEKMRKAQIVEAFLHENASQLTYYGLAQLFAGVAEGELCVFFRNNHFCTMKKRDKELYLLATDVGFFDQPDIVWEKLVDITNDNAFCDGNFRVYHPRKREPTAPSKGSITVDHLHEALSQVAAVPASVASAVGGALDGAVSSLGGGGGGGRGQGAGQTGAGAAARGEGREGAGEAAAQLQAQEDADLAFALSLQAQEEEEAERRQEQQQEREMARQAQAQGAAPRTQAAPARGGGGAGQAPAEAGRAGAGAQAPAAAAGRAAGAAKKKSKNNCVVQ